jgi:hypothetical protein
MQLIPISAIPSQTFNVVLASQNCTISIYQKTTGVFCDVVCNGIPICYASICLNNSPIVLNTYNGFIGNLSFVDTIGSNDPVYTGFGSRYQLLYLQASDL